MTNLILVTYDLNHHEKWNDYKKLKDAINTYLNNKKILYSVYIVKTNDTAQQVCDKLLPCIDENDRLFCTEIKSSTSQGRLSSELWKWIQEI